MQSHTVIISCIAITVNEIVVILNSATDMHTYTSTMCDSMIIQGGSKKQGHPVSLQTF